MAPPPGEKKLVFCRSPGLPGLRSPVPRERCGALACLLLCGARSWDLLWNEKGGVFDGWEFRSRTSRPLAALSALSVCFSLLARLSFCLSLPACLSVSLSFPLSLSLCLSASPPVCLSACRSACPVRFWVFLGVSVRFCAFLGVGGSSPLSRFVALLSLPVLSAAGCFCAFLCVSGRLGFCAPGLRGASVRLALLGRSWVFLGVSRRFWALGVLRP